MYCIGTCKCDCDCCVKYKKRRITNSCEICGESYLVDPYYSKKSTCCSTKCRMRKLNKNQTSAILNDEKVKEIINLIKQKIRLKDIAEKFGVKQHTISYIKRNKTWKHLPR